MKRVLGVLALAGVLTLAGAGHVAAAPTTEVIDGRYLQIVSVADWQAAKSLEPGQVLRWDLVISAEAPEPGTIDVTVSALGLTPLEINARLCMSAWDGETCPRGERQLRSGWQVPRDGLDVPLANFPSAETAHLRLGVTLGPGPAPDGAATQVTVRATGVGESIEVNGEESLAQAGAPARPAGVLATAGLTLLGAAALVFARGRRRANADGREG